MQHPNCTSILVMRTIGADRGRAARGAPAKAITAIALSLCYKTTP